MIKEKTLPKKLLIALKEIQEYFWNYYHMKRSNIMYSNNQKSGELNSLLFQQDNSVERSKCFNAVGQVLHECDPYALKKLWFYLSGVFVDFCECTVVQSFILHSSKEKNLDEILLSDAVIKLFWNMMAFKKILLLLISKVNLIIFNS